MCFCLLSPSLAASLSHVYQWMYVWVTSYSGYHTVAFILEHRITSPHNNHHECKKLLDKQLFGRAHHLSKSEWFLICIGQALEDGYRGYRGLHCLSSYMEAYSSIQPLHRVAKTVVCWLQPRRLSLHPPWQKALSCSSSYTANTLLILLPVTFGTLDGYLLFFIYIYIYPPMKIVRLYFCIFLWLPIRGFLMADSRFRFKAQSSLLLCLDKKAHYRFYFFLWHTRTHPRTHITFPLFHRETPLTCCVLIACSEPSLRRLQRRKLSSVWAKFK